MASTELTAGQKLLLCQRANQVYEQQVDYNNDSLSFWLMVLEEKENIINNIESRYQLGSLKQQYTQTVHEFNNDSGFHRRLLRFKLEELTLQTVHENGILMNEMQRLWQKCSIIPQQSINQFAPRLLQHLTTHNKWRDAITKLNNEIANIKHTHNNMIALTAADRLCSAEKANTLYKDVLLDMKTIILSLQKTVGDKEISVANCIFKLGGWSKHVDSTNSIVNNTNKWSEIQHMKTWRACATNMKLKKLQKIQYYDKMLVFGYVRQHIMLIARNIPESIANLILCFETTFHDYRIDIIDCKNLKLLYFVCDNHHIYHLRILKHICINCQYKKIIIFCRGADEAKCIQRSFMNHVGKMEILQAEPSNCSSETIFSNDYIINLYKNGLIQYIIVHPYSPVHKLFYVLGKAVNGDIVINFGLHSPFDFGERVSMIQCLCFKPTVSFISIFRTDQDTTYEQVQDIYNIKFVKLKI